MELNNHHCTNRSLNKRRRVDEPLEPQLNLKNLPIDLLSHITTFSNIEDYIFNILPISKHFNQNLSPITSPFIIKQLIQNECYNILDDINPFDAFNEDSDNVLTPWRDWILSGSYAWINDLKIPRIHTKTKHEIWYNPDNIPYYYTEKNNAWINCLRKDDDTYNTIWKTEKQAKLKETGDANNSFQNDKKNGLSSSLYFLHTLHKIRYGGINKIDDIKVLFEKLLYSYGGSLGMRYLFWFFMKEFIYKPLKDGRKEHIVNNNTHKIVRDLLWNLWIDLCFNKLSQSSQFIDLSKEWYIKQLVRDLDQIQIDYIKIMEEIDEKRASIMQRKLDIYKRLASHFYDDVYQS